jgi:hypothetical protein
MTRPHTLRTAQSRLSLVQSRRTHADPPRPPPQHPTWKPHPGTARGRCHHPTNDAGALVARAKSERLSIAYSPCRLLGSSASFSAHITASMREVTWRRS